VAVAVIRNPRKTTTLLLWWTSGLAIALVGPLACKRQTTTVGPAASVDPATAPRDSAPDVKHEGCLPATDRHRDASPPYLAKRSDDGITVHGIGWCFDVDLKSGAYRRCKEGESLKGTPPELRPSYATVREGAVAVCKRAGGCFATLAAPGCHSAYTFHQAGPVGADSCGVALREDGLFAVIEAASLDTGGSATWLYQISGPRLVKHFASPTSECGGPQFVGERLLCRGTVSELVDPASGKVTATVGGPAPIRAASELRPNAHDNAILDRPVNDTPHPVDGNVWAFEGIGAAVIVLQDVTTGAVLHRVDLEALFPKDAAGHALHGQRPTAARGLTRGTLVVALAGGAAGDVVTIDTVTGAVKRRYGAPSCAPVGAEE